MARPVRLLLIAMLVGASGAATVIGVRIANSNRPSSIVDLGTLGGSESEATGINNVGDVVGQADIAGASDPNAFLWRHGHMVELQMLENKRDPMSPTADSNAYGVNDAGIVVGDCDLGGGDPTNGRGTYDAVIWENGSIHDIGTLAGFQSGSAQSINNSGVVVCKGIDESNGPRSYEYNTKLGIYKSGRGPGMIDALLYAANNRGDAAGVDFDHGRYRIRVTTSGVSRILGDVTTGEQPINIFINDHGQVFATICRVVTSPRDSRYEFGSYVLAWRDGKTRTILPAMPGYPETLARGINNRGQVVGEAFVRDQYPPSPRAVLWNGAAIVDLTEKYANWTGWKIESAAAINDSGVIVGRGRNGVQQHHAVMIRTVAARS